MAQFDVYIIAHSGTRVLDVQSDLLEPLDTRVVVPLLPSGSILKPAKRLNPVLSVQGERMILAVQFIAAVQVSELNGPIEKVTHARDEVTAALDMLYQGF